MDSFTSNDSLAIYQKILGKYTSIHAAEIIVTDGTINISTRNEESNTNLKGIYFKSK